MRKKGELQKMTPAPTIRVGMPVYNEVRFVGQAIDAVLKQDYSDLELIISDNSSTDGTREICEQYAKADERVTYIRHDENRGAAWNFAYVFHGCKTPYFMWAGSHDLINRSLISKCLPVLENDNETAVAYPQTQVINGSGDVIIERTQDAIDTRGEGLVRRVSHIVKGLSRCDMLYGVFRTEILRKCRLGIVCRGTDHVLLMETSLHGAIAYIPEVLFVRREARPDAFLSLSSHERTRSQLARVDPSLSITTDSRPYWRMGLEHIRGVLAAPIPVLQKAAILITVTTIFAWRWRRRLKSELVR